MRDLNSACPAVQLFAQYCLENYQAYQESTTTNGTSTSANANSSDSGDSNRGGGGGGATNSVTDGQQVQVGDNGNNANFAVTGENWVARSKVFVRCDNIHELTQLPKFLHAYNAKPALIRESGTLVR